MFNELSYTNGSKMEGKCGCGVFLENLVAFKCRVDTKSCWYSREWCNWWISKRFYFYNEITYNKLSFKEIFPIINKKTLEGTIDCIDKYDFERDLEGRKYILKNNKFSFNLWFSHVRSRDHLFRKNITNPDLLHRKNCKSTTRSFSK